MCQASSVRIRWSSSPSTASTAPSAAKTAQSAARPQFTDHYFTGDYPTRLLDKEWRHGQQGLDARQTLNRGNSPVSIGA
jgi:hypothetical protein